MPQGDWSICGYRIDARGHIPAILITRWYEAIEYWRWCNLNGDIIESGANTEAPYIYPHYAFGLKIDTRGHALAVLAYFDGESPFHWYDLNGDDLGVGPGYEYPGIIDLRLDARGQILAVASGDPPVWYNLNAEAV